MRMPGFTASVDPPVGRYLGAPFAVSARDEGVVKARPAAVAGFNLALCMVTCMKSYTWRHCRWLCTGESPLAVPFTPRTTLLR